MSTGEGPGSPAHCCGDRWGTWVDQRRGTLVGRALWEAWGVYTCVNHLEEVGSEAAGERGTCFSWSRRQRWRCAGVSSQLLGFRTHPDPSVPRGSFPWAFRGHPRSHYPTAAPVSPPCWRPSPPPLPPAPRHSIALSCLISSWHHLCLKLPPL